MKNIITIWNVNSNGSKDIYKKFSIKYDEPNSIWDYIKLKLKNYNENDIEISINSIFMLFAFDFCINEDDSTKYLIDLYYEPTVIKMIAYNNVNKDQGINCFMQSYIFNNKNEGNCIDDFIKRGINPLLNNIETLKESIISRKNERISAIEYHNTWCYEKDFAQISLIKKQAEKIVENCNKHLERISEFYTKL